MNKLLHPTAIKFSNRSCVWLPFCWWSICYTIWITRGCDPFFPFISEFGSWEPEATIFCVGLNLTAAAFLLRVIQLHQVQHQRMRYLALGLWWQITNHLALGAGVVVSLAVWALAFVPWNQNISLHLILAMTIFRGGLLWCVLATCMTWKFKGNFPDLKKALFLRLAGSIATGIGLVGMIQTVVVVYTNDVQFLPQRIQLSLSDKMAFCSEIPLTDLVYGAAFEWVLVIGLLFVSWTFNADLRRYTVKNAQRY